ncbi:MAG: NAD(P)H-dependent oxidoreductase, partial [Bdellovibrionales bacterium]|nr:NAD(P)H-dependent oxidoreductase [Bdellovibrionales bacterium]
ILELLKEQLKTEIRIDIYDGIKDLPHFNPDIEFESNPEVLRYRELLKSADAILISTPEYAHGIPGSLKNALDWVVGSGELIDKKIGLFFTASSGEEFVKVQLFEVIKTMSADIKMDHCLKLSGVKITPEMLKIINNLIK